MCLLSVISKEFSCMVIARIKTGVDKRLRKEHAGFRPGRVTTEHPEKNTGTSK